jgi:hypothetical protein
MPGSPHVPSNAKNIVGPRIRFARENGATPLTQDQLADKLAEAGVALDRVMIAKIETGRRCVYDFEVVALAVALAVNVCWLLGININASSAKGDDE